jgi:hypothetical protein
MQDLFEEYFCFDDDEICKKNSDEGYRAGAMTQIFVGFSEVDIPIGCYIGQTSEVSVASVHLTQSVTFLLLR